MKYLYCLGYLLVVSIVVMPWVGVSLYFKTNKAEYQLQEQRKQFKIIQDLRFLRSKHIEGF